MSRLYPAILLTVLLLPSSASAQPEPILLKPDRVFDGTTAHARGMGRAREGREDRGRRAGRPSRGAEGREGHRPARHDAPAGPHRRALAPAAPPLRQDEVGRSGAQGAARGARLPGDRSTRRPTSSAASPRSATSAPRARAIADVGIKSAIEKGIIPGPRLLVTTKAIVATGSYARGVRAGVAHPARGGRGRRREPAHGRPRADPRRGRLDQGLRRHAARPGPGAKPAFSLDELKLIVATAKDAGVPVVRACAVEGGHAAGGARRASRPSSTATTATSRSSG